MIVDRAAAREPRVTIVDLGSGAAALLAEYDCECDTIRINARAVERIEALCGSTEAALFVESACEHERFHRAHPQASEAAAHAHVRAVTGGDPLRFEAYVRGAARERP